MVADFPGQWREMTDADAGELRIRLEALGFKNEIGKEKMRDALEIIGNRNQFDAAEHWLKVLVPPWDGVPRIHLFWPNYMQTKDTPYTRALGEYSWTAQAGRVLDPGCKVDMVPVLVGEEGTRKSTAVSLIAPKEDFFTEFNLGLDDEKLSRLMRGCLVGELAELRGISARDAEGVLSWVTRRFEKWTPKFKEYAISLARRLVFYGTTNDPEFLQAHMGQRRWLPVLILGIIDTQKIVDDRLQLWAEAREVFLESGIAFERVETLAKAERKAFEYVDPWFDTVTKGLDDEIGEDEHGHVLTLRNCGTLTSERVLRDLLGFDDGRIKRPDQMRASAVLKACGMVQIQRKLGGRTSRVWVPTSSDLVATPKDRRTREGRS
jgi:predicted P-loop ATPase